MGMGCKRNKLQEIYGGVGGFGVLAATAQAQ